MNVQEILQQIAWKDEKQSGNSLGNLNEVFPNAEILMVPKSKTNAERATVMIKQNGKVYNLTCSLAMTPLVRSGKLTKEHIVGFPIIFNEKQNSLYIGLPSAGWVEVSSITVAEYKPQAVSLEELIA